MWEICGPERGRDMGRQRAPLGWEHVVMRIATCAADNSTCHFLGGYLRSRPIPASYHPHSIFLFCIFLLSSLPLFPSSHLFFSVQIMATAPSLCLPITSPCRCSKLGFAPKKVSPRFYFHEPGSTLSIIIFS